MAAPRPRGGWPFTNPPNVRFRLNNASPQADGLVGWWPIIDSFNSGYVRDLIRGATTSAGLAGGNVWRSSAVGPMLEGPNQSGTRLLTPYTFNDPQFSYSCGIQPNSFPAGEVYWLFEGTSSGRNFRTRNSGVIGVWGGPQGSTVLPLGEPSHVVITHDGTTTTIYLNGVYESSGADAPAAGGAFQIFEFGIGGGPPDGSINDVRVYSRALTPGEVLRHYQNPWELYAPEVPMFWSIPVGAGVTVSKDLQAQWDIAELVNKDLAALFDIFNLVNKDLAAPFDILGLVNKDLATQFDILILVNKDLAAPFDIFNLVNKDIQATWDMTGRVSKSLQARWDVFGEALGKGEGGMVAGFYLGFFRR